VLLGVAARAGVKGAIGELRHAFIGMQISVSLRCAGRSGAVLAGRHIQSAWVPLVAYILRPLMMSSSPLRRARVFSAAMPDRGHRTICSKSYAKLPRPGTKPEPDVAA